MNGSSNDSSVYTLSWALISSPTRLVLFGRFPETVTGDGMEWDARSRPLVIFWAGCIR